MPFKDIPSADPFLRCFTEGPTNSIVFSSHGIWRPDKDGMTRVNYTYYWYTQPTEALSGSQYALKLKEMGAAPPVDTFGPGSGQVANMLLLPLEYALFHFTTKTFTTTMKESNPQGLALLAFHGNKAVPGMRLNMLDTQLLPALNYPVSRPVHMVVCRSLGMRHVTPVVTHNVRVIIQPLTPFDIITNDML